MTGLSTCVTPVCTIIPVFFHVSAPVPYLECIIPQLISWFSNRIIYEISSSYFCDFWTLHWCLSAAYPV